MNQYCTPYFDAMLEYVADKRVPFHTPGHKQGKGALAKFKEFMGEQMLKLDLDIDDLKDYEEVLKKAEALAAQAYGADRTFFLVNGTTSGIHTMILAVCGPGDKIIVPRDAHKSIVSGIVLSGAIPVFVSPVVDRDLNISYNIEPIEIKKALDRYPEAKAVLVVSPTYYGLTTNLEEIAEIVHRRDKLLLVDEAWGAHLKFHPELPSSALESGADMCVNSTHKLLSGMTQTSMLHARKGKIGFNRIQSIINFIQTTSPSCILRASLDCARMQMATEGRELLDKTIKLANEARERINQIKGLYCFGKELIGQPGVCGMDPTRLTIDVRKTGYSGFEAERILQEEYKLKVEMADMCNILVVITIGDGKEEVDYLIDSLRDFALKKRRNNRHKAKILIERYREAIDFLSDFPHQELTPREAIFSLQEPVRLSTSIGKICAEIVTPFPPGVPLLWPGERISPEVVEYLQIACEAGMRFNGPEDLSLETIKVVKQ